MIKEIHRFFPLFVDITGKTVLIIGGGKIALRRVSTLLQFDCRIHIIAEKPRSELETLAGEYSGRINIDKRLFRGGDCSVEREPPFFVIAATDRREVNRAIAVECSALNIPVSVADCKDESTFYFPATAINDTIVAGICSGGNDHRALAAAAVKIREAIGKQ
ncbi:MAG: NAD(P)-dependent oxidoreductase [Treponema sp.]|nr:NAD(P)-dependent oxidoreductase [Treponema sp.]